MSLAADVADVWANNIFNSCLPRPLVTGEITELNGRACGKKSGVLNKKRKKKGSLAKRKTFPDRIKAKFAKELRESRRKRKRKVQKWKTSTYGRRATGIDWKSGMHIGKYEYENRPLESDTEVDGLMPLDGIDLIGVDWEIPSDRQGRLVDGQAIAILRLL